MDDVPQVSSQKKDASWAKSFVWLRQYMYIYICIHTYFGLILAQSSKHRTWMGIDKPLPIQNLDDFWFTSASTPINNELKQALNHNWHAWIRVVLNAVEPEIIEKTRNTHKQIGASQRSFLYVLRPRF